MASKRGQPSEPGGGSPRSPSARSGGTRLGHVYGDRLQVAKAADYTKFKESLSTMPKDRSLTYQELIALRRAVPPPDPNAAGASLAERFLVPPFSVLDARQGYWQARKRAWLAMGMTYGQRAMTGVTSGFPGGGGTSPKSAMQTVQNHRPHTRRKDGKCFNSDGLKAEMDSRAAIHDGALKTAGQCFNIGRSVEGPVEGSHGQYSTPVFDPVLCEVMFRWFCPPRGHVVDPFAGTAISGVVAAKLGRRYTGIDINPTQVEQNRMERDAICTPEECGRLEWVHGDSSEARSLLQVRDCGRVDMLYSCPPYGDLVRYSDDARDISTMDYHKFLGTYQAIIRETCECLREDRFAVYVVGEFRDPRTGSYRGFIGDTVAAHRAAGLELYNDMVLVTAVGSLPLRVGGQFTSSRKVGKTHQNVLVFVKGDPVRATAACGEVDATDLEMPEYATGMVAVCTKDCSELDSGGYVCDGRDAEADGDVVVLDMPRLEACLLVDVIRGEARTEEVQVPRVWVGTATGWMSVPGIVEMTYLVGDEAYLSRSVFSDARGPQTSIPNPSRLE